MQGFIILHLNSFFDWLILIWLSLFGFFLGKTEYIRNLLHDSAGITVPLRRNGAVPRNHFNHNKGSYYARMIAGFSFGSFSAHHWGHSR